MKRAIRVLFISCSKNPLKYRQDPSFIYRCENLAAGLRSVGHEAYLCHFTQVPLSNKFDIALVHRPRKSLRLAFVLSRLKRKGCRLIADCDDLIFQPEAAHFSPGVILGINELDKTRKLFSDHHKIMSRFEDICVSTQALYEEAVSAFPRSNIHIIPNAIHFSWLSEKLAVDTTKRFAKISYFAGTRSHDHDLASITPVIMHAFKQMPQLHLSLVGPIEHNLELDEPRLSLEDKLDFTSYKHRVSQTWLNIAPLSDNRFNRCKSAIKVIEAAFFGIPTICTITSDTQRLANSGALLAQTHEDWFEHIYRMYHKPSDYVKVAHVLRERILEQADIKQIASWFVDRFRPEQ